MVNFMLDPKGDMPWSEDPQANDVIHLSAPKVGRHAWNRTVDSERARLGSATSDETAVTTLGHVLCPLVRLLQALEARVR